MDLASPIDKITDISPVKTFASSTKSLTTDQSMEDYVISDEDSEQEESKCSITLKECNHL